MFDNLPGQTGVPDAIGLAFQQRITKPGAGLWAMRPGFEMTFLGCLPGHETDSW